MGRAAKADFKCVSLTHITQFHHIHSRVNSFGQPIPYATARNTLVGRREKQRRRHMFIPSVALCRAIEKSNGMNQFLAEQKAKEARTDGQTFTEKGCENTQEWTRRDQRKPSTTSLAKSQYSTQQKSQRERERQEIKSGNRRRVD